MLQSLQEDDELIKTIFMELKGAKPKEEEKKANKTSKKSTTGTESKNVKW